jgi:predicted nucleic acid-binding protein
VALTYLLDTSVVKRLGVTVVRERIDTIMRTGLVGRPTVCDLEVGYSARTADEWDALIAALDAFDPLETSAEHIRRALHVQRLLAARSQRGRKIPDLLVAAAAESAGATVLHYDADFDHIASVTGQPCQWVVPRGSID